MPARRILFIMRYRLLEGLTPLNLAIRSNLDGRQIQRLERSHTAATLKTILKLTEGMYIDLIAFF